MLQEHQQLRSGLTEQQQTQHEKQLQQMDRTKNQLDTSLDALDFELAQTEVNGDRVREKARDMDKTLKKLEDQQRDWDRDMTGQS
jgi:septal ring factor EnvC (AmiA/AmiB activator)